MSISAGDILISGSILISAIGATWRIGNRFARVESKLDAHLSYHKGYDAGLSTGKRSREGNTSTT